MTEKMCKIPGRGECVGCDDGEIRYHMVLVRCHHMVRSREEVIKEVERLNRESDTILTEFELGVKEALKWFIGEREQSPCSNNRKEAHN